MGRPKGSKNKKEKKTDKPESINVVFQKPEANTIEANGKVIHTTVNNEHGSYKVEKKCSTMHLLRCQCQDVLGIGQSYFEDGETGTIVIGESTKDHVLLKVMENGKETARKINKKR